MSTNVLYIQKFQMYQDLKEFAEELQEEWAEMRMTEFSETPLDLISDLEEEFYLDSMNMAGLGPEERDYVWRRMGYDVAKVAV